MAAVPIPTRLNTISKPARLSSPVAARLDAAGGVDEPAEVDVVTFGVLGVEEGSGVRVGAGVLSEGVGEGATDSVTVGVGVGV
jgi:hypothetical protein